MRSTLIVLALLTVSGPAYAQESESEDFYSFGYARLGYGGVFAGDTQGAPGLGFGYRGEFKSMALDISFLNYMFGTDHAGDGVFAGSLLKLMALRFINPEADGTAYLGAGLSWGGLSGSSDSYDYYSSGWHGSGLQGELTAGYELARRSPVRMFIQADIGLPFYNAVSNTYTFTRVGPLLQSSRTVDERYIPSAVVSIGIGWRKR